MILQELLPTHHHHLRILCILFHQLSHCILELRCLKLFHFLNKHPLIKNHLHDRVSPHSFLGNDLEKVEREDEFIVESVQKGVNSSFYKAGRFSPKREKGVHHFHRLIASYLNN